MKNIITIIAVSIFALSFNSQIIASGYSGETKSEKKAESKIKGEAEKEAGFVAEAIKHAEMAKAHEDDEKKILQHAEMSLKYAQDADDKAIEDINTQGAEHITASIGHLEEAIEHAKMGHADVASKHIGEALNEMHQYTVKPVDYLEN